MTTTMRQSKPPLVPLSICIICFFLSVSTLLHIAISSGQNGDVNPLSMSSDWQLRRPPRLTSISTKRQEKVRQEFEQRYPPDMNRTRSFVKSLRSHNPKPVQDEEIHYDINDCPPDPPIQYPAAWSVVDVLNNWNPINETVPLQIYQGLCVFDYTRDLGKALRYRQAEVPFILVNAPEIWQTAERWNRDDYLSRLIGNDGDNKVEHSTNHHFMYWKTRPHQRTPARWKEPTEMTKLSFQDWLEKATASNPHDWYYFRFNAIWKDTHTFMYEELPIFKPIPSFFMVEPSEQRGINCRFGMTGVLAEAHYDSSRNWITVLKGSRRYILAHPRECRHLELYPKEHPSGRHASVDWTNFSVQEHPLFASAQVNEVLLQAGDALYLPTHWFHFIQSLDLNYQVCSVHNLVSAVCRGCE